MASDPQNMVCRKAIVKPTAPLGPSAESWPRQGIILRSSPSILRPRIMQTYVGSRPHINKLVMSGSILFYFLDLVQDQVGSEMRPERRESDSNNVAIAEGIDVFDLTWSKLRRLKTNVVQSESLSSW